MPLVCLMPCLHCCSICLLSVLQTFRALRLETQHGGARESSTLSLKVTGCKSSKVSNWIINFCS